MRELTVGNNEAGQRLNKYLMKYLDKAPSSFVYKMLRKKNIKLNKAKAEGNEILKTGDLIQLFLSDETVEGFRRDNSQIFTPVKSNKIPFEVAYEDADVLFVNKPLGILSQKATEEDYSINEALVNYLLESNKITTQQLRTFRPSICNRLDRNTSGLVLCGVSLAGLQELSRIIKDRLCDKYYFTIVKGIMQDKIESSSFLYKDEELNKVYISDSVQELEQILLNSKTNLEFDEKSLKSKISNIVTSYEPVCSNDMYTLVKVLLVTGKTHQIRAHLNYLGYPVIGDKKYGRQTVNAYFQKEFGLRNQLLHNGLVVFHDNIEGKLSHLSGKSFHSDAPQIFNDICDKLFGRRI